MSYSPFFLSGFQHASSPTDKVSPHHTSFPATSSSQTATTSRVRRQRSSANLKPLAISVPPASSLPEIPTPTPGSYGFPKQPRTPTKMSDSPHRRSTLTSVLRSNSTVSTSTVSTRYRRNQRSDALERLEGRSSRWYSKARGPWIRSRPVRTQSCNDFMSMSDESDSDENDDSFIDVGLKIHPQLHPASLPISSPTRTSSSWFSTKRLSKLVISLPPPSLHSFIDLAENDTRSQWKGRSFIQISPTS